MPETIPLKQRIKSGDVVTGGVFLWMPVGMNWKTS